MKKLTKAKKISIMLCCVCLYGIFFDLVVSYIAFLENPEFFIIFEANKEIIPFFTDGVIPWIFIIFTTISVIIIFPLIKYSMQEKQPKIILGFSCIYFLSSLSHICGGLSWYDPSMCLAWTGMILTKLLIVFYMAYVGLVLVEMSKTKPLNTNKVMYK